MLAPLTLLSRPPGAAAVQAAANKAVKAVKALVTPIQVARQLLAVEGCGKGTVEKVEAFLKANPNASAGQVAQQEADDDAYLKVCARTRACARARACVRRGATSHHAIAPSLAGPREGDRHRHGASLSLAIARARTLPLAPARLPTRLCRPTGQIKSGDVTLERVLKQRDDVAAADIA